MTTLTDVLLILFILGFIADIINTAIKDYKGKNAAQKRQERQDLHNEAQKGVDYVKSIATSAVITAAKNGHYNTGLGKKQFVIKLVQAALLKAHLDVPDAVVDVLIQSAYETTKNFIKTYHIDSRENNTKAPSDLSSDEIQKKIEGSK